MQFGFNMLGCKINQYQHQYKGEYIGDKRILFVSVDSEHCKITFKQEEFAAM